MIEKIIGKKIKKIRKELGLTQKQFAEKFDIHYNLLGKYERGEVKPKEDKLNKIAQEINQDVSWFFFDEDVPDTNQPTRQLQENIIAAIKSNNEELSKKLDILLNKLTLAELTKKIEEENNVIPFPIHRRNVSYMEQAIGAGEKLAEDIKPIGTLELECRGKPDVAIRVEGLSMEPDILDGSLILVRRTQLFGPWGWKDWDIVVVWLKETDEWTVKQIHISPDKKKAKLIGTKGFLKIYEMKDIEVQGVVEDVIKNPNEVNKLLEKIKDIKTEDE